MCLILKYIMRISKIIVINKATRTGLWIDLKQYHSLEHAVTNKYI